MGNEIKPSGGGLWGWIKGALFSVGKSGAASETWKLIAPTVLGLMGAGAATIAGLAQQAPLFAIIVGTAVVFAAVVFVVGKAQAFLIKKPAVPPDQPEEGDQALPSSEPKPWTWLDEVEKRGGHRPDATFLDELLAGGIPIRPDPIGDALRRMADRPPPPPKRDVSLGEAMLYVLKGSWGLDFSGFDPHKDSYDLETIKWQFEEKFEDGSLQAWGSDAWVEGRYSKVPPDDWRHLKIHWQSLIEGTPRTTGKEDHSPAIEPRYNLMVNRKQVKGEFPQSDTTRPVAPPASPAPQPIEDHPLQAEVNAKAKLMRDRLESRNYHLGGFDSPRSISWLAAMWDAEERGQFLDEWHRSTFMPQRKGAPNDLPGDTIAELQRNVIEYNENRRKPNQLFQRRRELIDTGRDVVHRWRASDRTEPFEIFASKDRAYLDVQPFLGDEYQVERARRKRTIVTDDVEDYYAGLLLRELHRLAKEWGLE